MALVFRQGFLNAPFILGLKVLPFAAGFNGLFAGIKRKSSEILLNYLLPRP